MDYVLETQALCKSYKNYKALDHLCMHVPKGAIYGFVGKNGSGKTTLITGLQFPTGGSFCLYGMENTSPQIRKARRRMGAVVETPSIYLSMLLTSFVAECLLVLVWTAAYLIPGVILMEHAHPLKVYLCLYLVMLLELAVFSAIFTLLTMTLGNKAGSAVVCILCALILLMQGIVVQSMLEEPEYYAPDIMITDSGEVSYIGEMEPNPNYIPEGSRKRAVYEFLMDFTPGGQAVQLSDYAAEDIPGMCLYDAGWLIAAACAGVLLFRRKDLK